MQTTTSDKMSIVEDGEQQQQQQQQQEEEETLEDNQIRFQIELEFVQLLANPSYLNYLAQYKYFEDPSFIGYLKYLQYWKEPQYAKYLSYPHCLFFLDRLQDEKFRDECRKTAFQQYMFSQQHKHWQFYRKNREQEAANITSAEEGETGPSHVKQEEEASTTPVSSTTEHPY